MVVENPGNLLISVQEPSTTQDYVPIEESPRCKLGYSSDSDSTDSSFPSSKHSGETAVTCHELSSPTFDEAIEKTTLNEEDNKTLGTLSYTDKE